jgi:DNA helicase HerA-like ATPase
VQIKIISNGLYTILGQRGSGKTTLAKYLIVNLHKQGVKVKVYDYLDEYRNMQNFAEIHRADLNNLDKDFDEWLKTNMKEECFLVVEEADKFFPKSVRNITGIRAEFIHRGRHYGVGGMFISRRTANLHNDVLSQSYAIISFYQFLPNDVEYLYEFMGDDAFKLSKLTEHQFLVWEKGVIVGVFKL